MDASTLNWGAVVTAALVGFVIGGLWYSPLVLGNRWMVETGITEEQVSSGNKAKIFGVSLVALFIMSYCLAMFIASPGAGLQAGDVFSLLQQGAFYGFLTGFGWVFFAFVVVGLFELRSWAYICINGGYWVVTLTVMGGILGGWR